MVTCNLSLTCRRNKNEVFRIRGDNCGERVVADVQPLTLVSHSWVVSKNPQGFLSEIDLLFSCHIDADWLDELRDGVQCLFTIIDDPINLGTHFGSEQHHFQVSKVASLFDIHRHLSCCCKDIASVFVDSLPLISDFERLNGGDESTGYGCERI